jgi:site-specific DNA-cytosine methylase
MDETLANLEAVTLELEDETIETVDEKAFAEHRGNRDCLVGSPDCIESSHQS